MSKLSNLATDGSMTTPIYPPPTQGESNSRQKDFTGTSGQLTLLANTTYLVTADQDCYFLMGADPTASATTHATAGSQPLQAGQERLVETGAYTLMAVIRKTISGQLSCVPIKG